MVWSRALVVDRDWCTSARGATRLDDAWGKKQVQRSCVLFKPTVFWKKMHYIEESTFVIIGTFRPPIIGTFRRPPQWFGVHVIVPPLPLPRNASNVSTWFSEQNCQNNVTESKTSQWAKTTSPSEKRHNWSKQRHWVKNVTIGQNNVTELNVHHSEKKTRQVGWHLKFQQSYLSKKCRKKLKRNCVAISNFQREAGTGLLIRFCS